MNSKRLWKDMRLVTLISWYSLVNGLVAMVRRIPLIGSLLGDHYRFAVFKSISRMLSPLVMLILELLKTAASSLLCLYVSYGILTALRFLGLGLVPLDADVSLFTYTISTGAYIVLYLFSGWGSSRVVSEGDTLYAWQRYYHLDLHRSVVLLNIVRPGAHCLSRCLVWSLLFSVYVSVWSIADVVGWSLAVLLLEWAFAQHNYEKKIREQSMPEKKKPLLDAVIRISLAMGMVAALSAWNSTPSYFGWLLSAGLLYPAVRSVRYFWQKTDYSRLMEVSGDLHYSLSDFSANIKNDVFLKEEDLQNGMSPSMQETPLHGEAKEAAEMAEDDTLAEDSLFNADLTFTENRKSASGIFRKSAYTAKKSGYAYLNALFFMRHKRIIERPIWIRTGMGLVLGLTFTCISMFFSEAIKADGSSSSLVYFLPTVMYMLCAHPRLTKAMYVNCDKSLLHYSFYKEEHALLEMFRLRMISLWKLMALPTLLVLVLVFVNGLILRFSTEMLVVAMLLTIMNGAFFTIYPLFLYYVFQPYNSEGVITSFVPSLLNTALYLFCFFGAPRLGNSISPMTFSLLSVGAFALFLPFALFLIRRCGPKAMRKE